MLSRQAFNLLLVSPFLTSCDISNHSFMLHNCKKSCAIMEESNHPDKFKYKPRPYFEYEHSPTCQLYMAESSIPNAGLGMYTAGPISKGAYIYHPDIVMNYLDFEANEAIAASMAAEESASGDRNSDAWKAAVGNKKNRSGSCDKWAREDQCEENPVYMINFCAKSCAAHEAGLFDRMVDLKEKSPWLPNEYYWDPTNTESHYDADEVASLVPGLGALANSHTGLINCEMGRGTNDVVGLHRAKDAGVGAFSSVYNLPYKAKNHIPAGMEIFVQYGDNWFSEREWKFGPLPLSYHFEEADEIIANFWKHAKEGDPFAEDLYTLTRDLVIDKKTKMALPDTIEMAKVALTDGTAILTVPNAVRSPEWLEENGICLDNIRAEPSMIQQTGRGAFATRNLKEGEIVAPLSLLHIDGNRLRMWEEFEEGDYEELNKQLIVNYSYGHRDSTLLLFPYSPVVNFVNNNIDKTGINAEMRWSTSKYHAKDWEDLTVEEVLQKKQANIMLELVATRDIERGEEIYIDYGADWDDAWEEHVEGWEPVESGHIPLHQMNMEQQLRTIDEQRTNPYAENIMTLCFTSITAEDFEDQTELEFEWEDFQAVPRSLKNSWICEIIERYEVADPDTREDVELYKVRFALEENVVCTMDGIPRTSIEFAHKSYHSDQHLKNAFRHPIHIPDAIFPEKWKNLISD